MTNLTKALRQADKEHFADPGAGFAHYLGVHLVKALIGVAIDDIQQWHKAIDDFENHGRKGISDLRIGITQNTISPQRASKADKKKWRAELDRTRNHQQIIRKNLTATLADIAKLSESEQKAKLRALHQNFAQHNLEIMGEAPLSAIMIPDFKAATGELHTTSSEQTVLKLETAIERGTFKSSTHNENPTHDISGLMGGTKIRALAELTPDENMRESGAGVAVMRKLAERLADPKLGFGINVQRALQALTHFYITRRQNDNSVNVTINELADFLGFQRGANGHHRSDAYTTVREAVLPLESLSVQAFDLPSLKGFDLQTKISERAFSLTFYATDDGSGDRPAKRWNTLSFRPNKYYTAALMNPGSLLMGTDKKLNRLHPVNQRAEALLSKYLERQWRINLKNDHGSLNYKVKTLLTDGVGLPDNIEEKPSAETWHKLIDVLDTLTDNGTIKHWEGDERWQEIRDMLEKDGGRKRMSKNLWRSLLEARVSIEAAGQYLRHYKNHGLTYQGASADPLVGELRQYIERSGRIHARVAEDLLISKGMLSQILTSTKKISPAIRERIELLLIRDSTLPLLGL